MSLSSSSPPAQHHVEEAGNELMWGQLPNGLPASPSPGVRPRLPLGLRCSSVCCHQDGWNSHPGKPMPPWKGSQEVQFLHGYDCWLNLGQSKRPTVSTGSHRVPILNSSISL